MRCRVKSSGGSIVTVTAQPLGIALPITSVLCPYQAPTAPDTSLTVSLSLNDGKTGTYTAEEKPFVVYRHAELDYITPAKGDANGGNEVTIFGSGFTALSTDPIVRSQFLRCKFGPSVQSAPPSYHNDTAVICTSTWGREGPDGQPVAIALNRQSFHSSGGRVRYIFEGLHQPALYEAYFCLLYTSPSPRD